MKTMWYGIFAYGTATILAVVPGVASAQGAARAGQSGHGILLQLRNDGWPVLATRFQRPPKATRDVLFGPSLQFTQISQMPGFSHPSACRNENLAKIGGHGKCVDYKGREVPA